MCVHLTTHAHTTLPKLVVSDPSILINNPIILSVMCIWKLIVIFNLPLVLSCAPYPTNFWILTFFSVLVMFHTIASTFLSYFFHQDAVPMMVKDIDSRVLILDLTLPSCVNSGKTLILFASISFSVQWRSWCWPLAEGFSSSPCGPSPCGPLCRIAWVSWQVAAHFLQSEWCRKVQVRSYKIL